MAQTRIINPFKGCNLKELEAKDYTETQIRYLVELITSKKNTTREVADRYKIGTRTIKRWLKISREGGDFHQTTGRKPILDAEALSGVREELVGLRRAGKNPDKDKLSQLVLGQANSTRGRRNLGGTTTAISESTMKRARKSIGIKRVITVNGTAAAIREMRDPRNFFVEALITAVFLNHLLPGRIINVDATLVSVGENGTLSFRNTVDDPDGPPDRQVMREAVDADSNPTYTKVINHIADNGKAAPLFVSLQLDKMPDTAYIKIEFPGLGVGTESDGSITVVVAQTRGSHVYYPALIEHGHRFMAKQRKYTSVDIDSPDAGHMGFIFDGEHAQVTNYNTADNSERMQELGVMLIKGPASCSAIGNALDAGNLHRATKAKNRAATDASWQQEKEIVIQRLTKKFNECLAEYLPSPEWVRHNVNAVLRIMHAYEGVLNQKIVRHSFIKSGHIPPVGIKREDWDVLQAKMSLCKINLSLYEYQLFKDAFEDGKELIKKGYLTEKEMDNLKLPRYESEHADTRIADKEERPISNRRGTVLSTMEMKREVVKYAEDARKTSQDRNAWAKHNKAYTDATSSSPAGFAAFKITWRLAGLKLKMDEEVIGFKIQIEKTLGTLRALTDGLDKQRTNEDNRAWKKKLQGTVLKVKQGPRLAMNKFAEKNSKYSEPTTNEIAFIDRECGIYSAHVDEAFAPLLAAAGDAAPVSVSSAASTSSSRKRSRVESDSSGEKKKTKKATPILRPEAPVTVYNKRIRKEK